MKARHSVGWTTLWLACVSFSTLFPTDANAGKRSACSEKVSLSRFPFLPPFYRKCVSAGGLPVVSSERVSDYALREAAWLIDRMLENRDDIRQALIANKVRFTVMAVDEFTTDIPEHSDLKPADYWDRRARGLGATAIRPCVSCGEENLLGYPGDPYATENILIHEFGHAIHEMGLRTVDPTFDVRLRKTYEEALKAGLWKGTYAATNKQEYWAEGVQDWFDTNRQNDHEHNSVNTREELKTYDPDLARLLADVFGATEWRYIKPEQRSDCAHLKGFDRAKAPRFVWPKNVERRYHAFQAIAHGKSIRDADGFWQEAEPLPIERLADVRSGPATTASSLLFVNRCAEQRPIYWINSDGQRIRKGHVAPDRYFLMDTWQSHVFLVTDLTNKPVALFRSSASAERALIVDASHPTATGHSATRKDSAQTKNAR